MAVTPGAFRSGSTLSEYVRGLWGDKTRLVPQQSVAVLTSTLRVLKNNPRRFGVIVMNLGTGTVTLDWQQPVVAGTGMLLVGAGSSLILTAFEDGELVGNELFAVAAAAGNTVAVWEIETL